MSTPAIRHLTLVVSALASLAACAALPPSYEANAQLLALPAVVLHQDSSGALSYHARTPAGIQPLSAWGRAQGRACQQGFQIPLLWSLGVPSYNRIGTWSISAGWGEGGYRHALADLRKNLPANAVLFDLRADVRLRTILSVYAEECLELDAAVFVPKRELAAGP